MSKMREELEEILTYDNFRNDRKAKKM